MTPRSRYVRPAPQPTIEQLLERQRDALDDLLADLADGPRDQRAYDTLEERAQAIGKAIPYAFRRGRRGHA